MWCSDVDLHSHSTHSDGTLDVATLAAHGIDGCEAFDWCEGRCVVARPRARRRRRA